MSSFIEDSFLISATRTAAALAILVAGACTTAMNWRFSYQLATNEWDSTIWAIFSVALDVTKWLMLPFAALAWRNHKLRSAAAVMIWLVATIYSFTAAIGFAASNRETAIAERVAQADLHKTLELMRQSPRWQSSAACADATAPLSKQFCARYSATEARLKGGSIEADPQSAVLARMTGLSPDTVRLLLSLFLAVACEVISALGLFAILPGTHASAQVKPPAAKWKPAQWSPPAPAKNNGASRQRSRRPA